MNRRMGVVIGWLLATFAVALIIPAATSAATGDLASQACVEDVGPPASGCGAENQGLLGARGVAVSPDGRSVYVTGAFEDAVSIFTRNTSTGALTLAGCISDADVFPGLGCAVAAEGLNAPNAIAVAPSGLDVYVAGGDDQAIVHLARDPSTGALSDGGCVAFTGDAAGCGTPTQAGINRPRDLVVSPDGASVYVAGGFANGSVARLARNTTTGVIAATTSCIGDAPGGVPGCSGTQEGLNDAASIAISPDGSSLHVASRSDSAVVSLMTAGLAPLGCFSGIALAGCTLVNGLSGDSGGLGITISPDGKSVYASSPGNGGAVVQFDRAPTGALTYDGCIQDQGAAASCAESAQGLGGVVDIAVSPDNATVYAVSDADHALVRFNRETTTGALTWQGCIADAGVGTAGCAGSAPAIAQSRGVTVSPDGKSVYQTAVSDGAVTHYTRESPGGVPPPPPSNEVRVESKKASCKGACKKVKVEVEVKGPGKVAFCSAPAGVHAPCGIGGAGPTGPSRALTLGSGGALVETKEITAGAAGTVGTSLKLTKKARKKLAKKGKLSIKLQVDFTPTGGERGSDRQTLKVKRKGTKKKGK